VRVFGADTQKALLATHTNRVGAVGAFASAVARVTRSCTCPTFDLCSLEKRCRMVAAREERHTKLSCSLPAAKRGLRRQSPWRNRYATQTAV